MMTGGRLKRAEPGISDGNIKWGQKAKNTDNCDVTCASYLIVIHDIIASSHYFYIYILPNSKMSRAPWNPFYSGPASPPPGPPSYNASTRPVPPVPAEPVSYTSLSDLTKGKQQQAPPASSFNYQPSSQRAGYREEGFTSGGGFGGGAGPSQPNQGGPAQGTRRLPPDPTAHRDKTLLPPKRNVPGKLKLLQVLCLGSDLTNFKQHHPCLKQAQEERQRRQPRINHIGKKPKDTFPTQSRRPPRQQAIK